MPSLKGALKSSYCGDEQSSKRDKMSHQANECCPVEMKSKRICIVAACFEQELGECVSKWLASILLAGHFDSFISIKQHWRNWTCQQKGN